MNKISWFYKNPIRSGILASAFLLVVYLIILSLANSFDHAIQQFFDIWYWMIPLVVGFGIQIGLFAFVGGKLQNVPKGSVAASGGVSTVSMAACCAHHITDVLPLIGLAAAAAILIKYQVLFLLIGVFSNLVGILMMLNIIKKHNLGGECALLAYTFKYDTDLLFKLSLGFGLIISISYAFILFVS